MAVLKCKMCGGSLDVTEGMTVCECEYCGTLQTVPSLDNEKKLTLFGRANRLRLSCEFDKAAGIYENIVSEFPEEGEAYWGLVLCRYGIEYVDDPNTGRKVPTCHRSSFETIFEDIDFEQACENADITARKVYREEAKAIEELRKGILEISGKEEPYDIFICYKEMDENNERTIDSVIAQDVYQALTEKGYRVFFSRITLEDKLGQEYEPYIFAALNSAKVMLVFGTDYEYFNAVWVKNEWNRFLELIASGQKKTLIPCYKDIDAYDMPKEFARLQAQDMGKVGAIQDLLRGIEKIMGGAQSPQPADTAVMSTSGGNISALLERGAIALEDENWDKAEELFDQVLNITPKCAEAYCGLAMAQFRFCNQETLKKNWNKTISENKNIQRAIKYGDLFLAKADEEYKEHLGLLLKQQKERLEQLAQYRSRLTIVQHRILAGLHWTIGVKSDGTLISAGSNEFGQCNVRKWTDIIAVSSGSAHTVGLRTNGSVVAIGNNEYGQCNVKNWANMIAISSGSAHTIGLQADGTVIATGRMDERCNVQTWTDIVAISAGDTFTIGLYSDGTVVSTGDNTYGQCNVQNWTDIAAISAGRFHTVGLRTDGTVIAIGDNRKDQCNVQDWTDIVAISAGWNHTAGLRTDGTIILSGSHEYNACDIQDLSNIVAISAGWKHTVGLRSDGTVIAIGNNVDGQSNVENWKLFDSFDSIETEDREAKLRIQKQQEEWLALLPKRRAYLATVRNMITAGRDHTIGLKSDGKIIIAGNIQGKQQDIQNWENMKAISSGGDHVVGLKTDGSVVAMGDNKYGTYAMSDWKNIKAISAQYNHIAGLRENGTVLAVGTNHYGECNVQDWTDIVEISANGLYTLGLKPNGTVIAVGDNKYGQCNVQDWTDIVAIAAGDNHAVGLQNDGSVVATGSNRSGQCDIENWTHIVAIAAGWNHTVGLKVDGTVFAAGNNSFGKCDVDEWTDIVAIAVGDNHTVGLHSDGTVVIAGNNKESKCDVSDWKLFHSIDTLEEELQTTQQQFLETTKAEIKRLETEQQTLQTELENLKGLFNAKRRKEIEERLAQIQQEKKKLQLPL